MSTDPLTPLAQMDADAQALANAHTSKRLSLLQRNAIVQAKQRNPNLTLRQIAEVIGCSHETVRVVLAEHNADALALMRHLRVQAVEAWGRAIDKAADKGYNIAARELLIATGDIAQDAKSSGAVAVQVNLSLSPGTPAYAPPPDLALDTHALPAPQPALTLTTHAHEHIDD